MEKYLFVLKILVEQFQRYLEMQAKIHKLPAPTPLPLDWDKILQEPDKPEED